MNEKTVNYVLHICHSNTTMRLKILLKYMDYNIFINGSVCYV